MLRTPKLLLAAVVITMLISSCKNENKGAGEGAGQINEPKTLSDLAYDRNPEFGYTVYLEEAGAYVPFLVLESAYEGIDGSVLVLRRELHDKLMAYFEYNEHEYYPDSLIDQYLNTKYMESLGAGLQKAVLRTDITVANWDSLNSTELKYEVVNRQAFLLSNAELGYGPSNKKTINEGRVLGYFKSNKSEDRVANRRGTATAWWIRTPHNMNNSMKYITFSGQFGAATSDSELALRPAFCLSGSLAVEKGAVGTGGGYSVLFR